MASHLTVISGTGGASASARAFAGQQPSAQNATTEPGGLMGLFSALLGNAMSTAPTAPAVPGTVGTQATGDLDLAGLFRLGLDGNFGDASDDDTADPDALAAAIDGPVVPAIPAEPKPMVDFVEALGALKASLDKGEPLDPELLEQVEGALTALADALGLELDDLPVPDDFAALLQTTGADETGLAGALTQLLSPLAQSLATATPATNAQASIDASATSTQLQALGDKLAALLGALEDGKVSAEKLAALGMTPGQPLDADIEAALSRFAAGLSAQNAAVPDEPTLAMPTLKVSEPVLTGKAGDAQQADAPEPVQSAPAPDRQADTGQDRTGSDAQQSDRGRDRPEPATRETRTAAHAAPAAMDASNTPAPSADASVQQPAGARIDATANPRIIQAGYQTSQQQLNLPQIAFELARQVQDGNTRFQIRLDPPELGRIDVRLDINESGQVHARLTVEKAETLDLMQRDQRGLERALQQAGLDSSKTNLEFSLKQNPFAGQQGQMGDGKGQGGADGGVSANDNGAGAAESEQPPMVNLYRGALQASGVNIIA
ncbi:Flagellar hook-length control protein FliK [Devosia lucknowensis]|uniref:Flagellar hook-length control protein FliK n=1 Tax=Devosia lucknowensis TaxID=1096929 RepID=A0A1Y6FLK8_9HYPH|nr:flagellar hook-length control protein FliK [Devosia lucknowensis]SMQ74401.1 Flagellar hook-length control protein FliK [Devosia lucknowensis]